MELRKALDDFQDSLKTFHDGGPGYVVETTLKVSSDLVHCIENVRAHLSTITPGAQLPTSFFDRVDVAWAEIFRTMHASLSLVEPCLSGRSVARDRSPC